MESLREKMLHGSEFLVGVELVSFRGSMAEKRALKIRDFANELAACDDVDWVSVTDNAGGNPQLAAHALAKPLLYAGKEVVIHLTCKDLNRNGLESQAWMLSSEGFQNILAITGDYPVSGIRGLAKPVFDIDSVGLISILTRMNEGFDLHRGGAANPAARLEKTRFLIGAVTTNFKLREGEVMPQYFKLRKKIECGAHYIINQVGYDARKMHELRVYMDRHEMTDTPLIGNVYVLNPRVAEIFHEKRIPGVIVSDELLEVCRRHGESTDRGKAFFLEFAARQAAICRGLGYRGYYVGGVHSLADVERILELERSFAPDDWKEFAREISFSRPGEFFFYAKDAGGGLIDPDVENPRGKEAATERQEVRYLFSKWVHDTFFDPSTAFARVGGRLCARSHDPLQGPKLMRAAEHASKSIMFACKDCGDCSLPDIAYLCPESQCAKNQRNGPCGGTRDGRCEVDGIGDCIWLRAYERRRKDGTEEELLAHAPVVQDQGLRNTSAWANSWLGRDHASKPALMPTATTEALPESAGEEKKPDRTPVRTETPV